MMGTQFSFFLAPADQLPFELALTASGDIAFLRDVSHSSTPEEANTSKVLAMGKERLDLWIARRQDLPDLRFNAVGARDEYSCDSTFAPVVEFGRCYVTDKFIRAGRLYRVDKFWNENSELVSKPDSFVEWAERLYKLAKASLTKVEQGCYAGAEAVKLRQAGVAFEGLDIEVGSIKS